MTLLVVSIDYCNQTILDMTYPGSGKVCKTPAETDAMIPFTLVYWYDKTFYFD
jgi:hypothetical protein